MRRKYIRYRNVYWCGVYIYFPGGYSYFRIREEFLSGRNKYLCRRENRRRGAGGSVPNSQSTVNESPGFRPDGGGQARRSIMSPRVRAVAGFKRFAQHALDGSPRV